MTDGQWILDMKVFKDTMRPAISTGLSVTRVGGVGQNSRQKGLAAKLNKTLAGYYQAEEYAHFGTELSADAQLDYDTGKMLFKVMNQDIGEGYNLMEQQFMLDIVLNSSAIEIIDIKKLKELVGDYASRVKETKDESNFDELRDDLKGKITTIDEVAKKRLEAEAAKQKAAEAQAAAAAQAAEIEQSANEEGAK